MKKLAIKLIACMTVLLSIILFGAVVALADAPEIHDAASVVYSVTPQSETVNVNEELFFKVLTDKNADRLECYIDSDAAALLSCTYDDIEYGRLWTVSTAFEEGGSHAFTAYAANKLGLSGFASCDVNVNNQILPPEVTDIGFAYPQSGDNILYSHDGSRYLNFAFNMDKNTSNTAKAVKVTAKDADSGSVLFSDVQYSLNSTDKSISILLSKFFPWLSYNYPLDAQDIKILTQGKNFKLSAAVVDSSGNIIATVPEDLSFTISYPKFNAGTSDFSLDAFGMNKYHTDCYTACFTHSKILRWPQYSGSGVKYIASLKVNGTTVVNNKVLTSNSFDMSAYYDTSDTDKEYQLTVGVFSNDLPYTGILDESQPNVFSAKFVYEAHPSTPVISKVAVQYDALTCSVSGCSNKYQARLIIKDKNKKVIYSDYAGQKLPAGNYYVSAYIKRFNCSSVSADVAFTVTSSDVKLYTTISNAVELIIAQEGSYTTVVKKDGYSLSIGKICWHGVNAHLLLNCIMDANPSELKANLAGTTLYEELLGNQDAWSRRVVDDTEKAALQKALATDNSIMVQDYLADEFIYDYISYGMKNGITDDKALIYFADLCNQGGKGGATTVLNSVSGTCTLDKLHQAALNSSLFSPYSARRVRVYNAINAMY